MTALAAVLATSPPSVLALAVLASTDAKRRRARAQPPAASRHRTFGAGLLALCAVSALATGGMVGLVIWAAAAAGFGWALSHLFAAAPDRTLATVDRAALLAPGCLRHPIASGTGGLRRRLPSVKHRAKAHGAALAIGGLALVCAVAAASLWRDVSVGSAAVRRSFALAVLDRIDRGETARRTASPCLAALAADRGGTGLRDVLSDRPATLVLRRGDDVATLLQRCILAAGGDGAEVERVVDGDRYALDGETAARVHADLVTLLLDDDALAELASGDGAETGLLCRRLARAIGPEVEDLVDALRRDRLYPKAEDLLLRIPALDRLATVRRTGATCPA